MNYFNGHFQVRKVFESHHGIRGFSAKSSPHENLPLFFRASENWPFQCAKRHVDDIYGEYANKNS